MERHLPKEQAGRAASFRAQQGNNTYKLNVLRFLWRRKQSVSHEKDFLVLKLHLETQLNIVQR